MKLHQRKPLKKENFFHTKNWVKVISVEHQIYKQVKIRLEELICIIILGNIEGKWSGSDRELLKRKFLSLEGFLH